MGVVLSYILPLIVAALCIIPPIDFRIPAPTEHWPLMIAAAGFLGIRILFIQTNILVKIFSILSLLLCFTSSVPYVSFNSYVMIVVGIYLYLALTKMDSWQIMYDTLRTLFVFNLILVFVQVFGRDNFLNFGLDKIVCYGVIGHHMHFGSFSVILSALLTMVSPLYLLVPIAAGILCGSVWAVVCGAAGIFTWSILKRKWIPVALMVVLLTGAGIYQRDYLIGKAKSNITQTGRVGIWKMAIDFTNDRPLTGWGPGTFKGVFHPISGLQANERVSYKPYRTAHNDWIQFGFEYGWPGLTFIVLAWGSILYKLISISRNPSKITPRGFDELIVGWFMITLNMMVHFPTRMLECVGLIIAYLAIASVKISHSK